MGWNQRTHTLTVYRYDVASGTALSSITLLSQDTPHLWAHDKHFHLMTTVWDGKACTINIFEVGPTLTKIESFPIQLGEHDYQIESFSPTTYHIFISTKKEQSWYPILNIRNSESLLDKAGFYTLPCFSSDGSLFATYSIAKNEVHIWKYKDNSYIPWKQFPSPFYGNICLLFSPGSSSILVCYENALKLWQLDSLSATPPTHNNQFGIIYHSSTYIVTAVEGEGTITITSLLSQTPSQFIDAGIRVFGLGLTSNVLLAIDHHVIMAWVLTEDGLVTGVSGNRRAGHGDSIWIVVIPKNPYCYMTPEFSVKGETGVVKHESKILHVYNIKTGEAIKPAQELLCLDNWYCICDPIAARDLYSDSVHNAFHKGNLELPQTTLEDGWIMCHEGKHLLWLPVEWQVPGWDSRNLFSDTVILSIPFTDDESETIIIRLR